MKFDFKEILITFMVLFAVIDIIENTPFIIDLRKKVGHIQSKKSVITSGIIMIVFLFLGKSLLSIIGIDANSFEVVGVFILFYIALKMILVITLYKDEDDPVKTSVFPLAFPLIAGPGSLTTLLSLRAEYNYYCVFKRYSDLHRFKTSIKIERILGPIGINIIRKVFGVILLAIAVKLFATTIK